MMRIIGVACVFASFLIPALVLGQTGGSADRRGGSPGTAGTGISGLACIAESSLQHCRSTPRLTQ